MLSSCMVLECDSIPVCLNLDKIWILDPLC